ncbi:MAG TPA: Hpt domain-containing protein [Candidatus Limnocylindria bacterium]|nr:Hpt domain-containing protein [Candidatus Limnocylindria bacterium]
MGDKEELEAIWEEHRELTAARLAVLARAARAAAAGTLDGPGRAEAASEAHMVAGAAGIFGYTEGARLAREIERTLKAPGAIARADGERLVALCAALGSALGVDTGSSP